MKIAVVGAGVVGLSTTKQLSRLSHEVRCFEAGRPMGGRSAGDARIFRVLHADASLIRLGLRARRLWDTWSGEALIDLLGREGLMVDLPDPNSRRDLMESMGAHAAVLEEGTEAFREISSHEIKEPLIFDPSAGVIHTDRVGTFLLRTCAPLITKAEVVSVHPNDLGAVVKTDTETWKCDAVLIAAGEHTARLAKSYGVDIDMPLNWHARFSFKAHLETVIAPCWFDDYENVKYYGLTPRPGHWAIGAHFPTTQTAHHRDKETVIDEMRAQIVAYVEQRLDLVDPTVIETLDCTENNYGEDGFFAHREGAVLSFWGDNLMKFAPVIGSKLSEALIEGAMPALPLVN